MKFGATLSRRSVPQWRTHDLDYDEIKLLIKEQTSSPDGCSREFERNLLTVLDTELERIDEFVRCKAGEIERRLAACQRTVKSILRERTTSGDATTDSEPSPLKKVVKFEGEIDRVSKDVQLLARYVNAQYTGFKKLLKKHAKWCRLSPSAPYSLSSIFIPHLETQRPFHRRVNFEHIMRELSALYSSRLDPDHSLEQQAQNTTPDAVLDNSMTSSVTYWVHNDNQVEVELFLLKHLILQLPSSSLASRDIQRAMRTLFLDSSDWSVYEHVVPETKNAGTSGAKVPQIVWEENSKNKDMVIAVPQGGKYDFLPMKRKNVSTFLSKDLKDADLSSSDWVTSMPAEEWAPLAQKVHDHIEEFALLPVIQLSAERASFVKVMQGTNQTGRIYATMDRNICCTRLPSRVNFINLDPEEDRTELEGYKSMFPHIVLKIRWSGDSPRWLEELNGSHLIERINGFSLYPQAVASLVPSSVSKLPFWMPMLQKDIRKLQPPPPKALRRDTASPYATADSSRTSSREVVRPTPSALSLKPSLHRTSRTSLRAGNESSGYTSGPPSPIVYWSEFENPIQAPYTIEVDENAPLLPWLHRKRRRDEEAGLADDSDNESFLKRTFDKIKGVVEFEVKTSADGLTTLFYEKEFFHEDEGDVDESPSDESSSDVNSSRAVRRDPHGQHRERERRLSDHEVSRTQLLNRGYCLCVVGCVIIVCVLGGLGLYFSGDAAGIAFVLVGFLISMSLEIVSLVRFIMQGGHSGMAWIGFVLVVLVGGSFVPLVAISEEV